MELDKIITGDSAVVLQGFEPDCIDLTVTSPPYDNLRTYNGFVFDFETIAKQLFRVTKAGGVVVWVVGDATVKGSETGTSFRQALFFKECGFNLHDTMIFEKINPPPNDTKQNRYIGSFEYMFIFSKSKPKVCNYIFEKSKTSGLRVASKQRKPDGTIRADNYNVRYTKENKILKNLWGYVIGADTGHPASFPDELARDHILSWSNEGDTVLDCFTGSGTTLKMAKMLNRHYIGIEISPEYVTLAEKRLLATPIPLFGQGRGLTPREPDKRDSSPSQAFTQPEFLSDLEGLS